MIPRYRFPIFSSMAPNASSSSPENHRGITRRDVIIGTVGTAVGAAIYGIGSRMRGAMLGGHPAIDPALARVQRHLDQSDVLWVPAGEIEERDCIDGRRSAPSVCTPGGDIGDQVMKLAAQESLTGKSFTTTDIDQ